MVRPPPISTITDTLLPYTTLFRAVLASQLPATRQPFSSSAIWQTLPNAMRPARPPFAFVAKRIAWRSTPHQRCSTLPERARSEEHTSEHQSLIRTPYAVFCLDKKIRSKHLHTLTHVHVNKTD